MLNFKNLILSFLLSALLVTTGLSAETNRLIQDNPPGLFNPGKVIRIDTSYDNVTNFFRWDVVFEENSKGILPDAFQLAVNGTGKNPKGHDGELAFFYLDASNPTNTILTVYTYNGLKAYHPQTSFKDGSGAPGVQAPDKILTSNDVTLAAAINLKTYSRDYVVDGKNRRNMGFSLDSSIIQDHVPAFAGSISDGEVWQGSQFEKKVGYWFHHKTATQSSYGGDGYLIDISYGPELGWVDVANRPTFPESPSCFGPFNGESESNEFTLEVGGDLEFNISVTDPQLENLSLSVVGAPESSVSTIERLANGNSNVKFAYQPPFADEGTMFNIDFTVTDSVQASATCSAKVTVNANPAPISNITSVGSLSCAEATTTISLDGSGSNDENTAPQEELTYSWTSNCPNAEFSDDSAASTQITFDSTVDNKPTGCMAFLKVSDGQKSDTAEIDLAVSGCTEDCAGTINGSAVIDKCGVCNGGDADLDRCGICNGDGNSCLDCTENDQSASIAELDSGLFQLSRDTFRLARSIRQNTNGKLGKRLNARLEETQELYEAGWAAINSIPSVVASCDNQQFCSPTVFTQSANVFEESTTAVRKNAKVFVRKLTRVLRKQNVNRAKQRRLRRPFKRIKSLNDENLANLNTLTISTDVCQ